MDKGREEVQVDEAAGRGGVEEGGPAGGGGREPVGEGVGSAAEPDAGKIPDGRYRHLHLGPEATVVQDKDGNVVAVMTGPKGGDPRSSGPRPNVARRPL